MLPTGEQRIQDGNLTTGLRNYEEFFQTLVSLTGESQNFDGNGIYVRFQAGGGLPGADARRRHLAAVHQRHRAPARHAPGQEREAALQGNVALSQEAVPNLNAHRAGP